MSVILHISYQEQVNVHCPVTRYQSKKNGKERIWKV